MSSSQDTEITLSTGRLLGMFFGLVVVCALFFGFGYTLGRGSAKQSGSLISDTVPGTTNGATGTKPAPGAQATTPKQTDCPAGTDCSGATTTATNNAPAQDLTFYKSVEQKDAPTKLDKPAEAATAVKNAAPEMKSSSGEPATGFLVQVAAVSKKEDAEMLMSALRQKQYPVFVTSLPNDKLFHVQVGPFAEMKDAESMKARLLGDGYNPIVKK